MARTRRCTRLAGVMFIMVAMVAALSGCGGTGDAIPADTGTLTGTVVEADTGSPLGQVRVSAGGVTATTDSSGSYTLRGVPAGWQTITVEVDPARNLQLPPDPDRRYLVRAGETHQLLPILLVSDEPPAPPY